MALEGYYCEKPIELLTQDEKETIHGKSLEILKNTGAVFHWEPALKLLKKAGCNVDFESQLVKFPPDIVEHAIKSCPSSFGVKARDPRYDIEFMPNRVYFTNQSAPFLYDLDTGERRRGTVKDIAETCTILDALENVHTIRSPFTTIADRPLEVATEHRAAEGIRNCTKSQTSSGANFSARWNIEIAKAAGIELLGNGSCEPPLTYTPDNCDAIMRYAEAGWGLWLNSGAQCGATAPATLAGTLVQMNAEFLAGLTLQQVVRPGVGFIYGSESMPLDMRNGFLAIGMEGYMLAVAFIGMTRFYNIPGMTYNCQTGGKLPGDQQVGYEKAMGTLLCAQSGASYIVGAGGIDDEAGFSIEQLLIDNEMYSMVGRFLKGITVNEETLAADLIQKVGPIPGNYLREAHTKKWWKQEQFLPTLSYRLSYEEWVRDGSKDVAARAREKAKDILNTHQVPPLSEDVDREISRILLAAEKEKRKK